MRKYDALVFDLDGTLWDTLRPVVGAWNEAAAEGGFAPVSDGQLQSIMGLAHEEAFRKLLPDASDQEVEKAAKIFYRKEVKSLQGNYLYPGVAEGIAQLSKSYTLYVVSNCQPDYLERFYELSGLRRFFKDGECHGATGLQKGDNISLVLRRNGERRAAYIGDTAGDQIASRAAGVDFYFASYGFGKPAYDCPSFGSFTDLTESFLSSTR